MVIDWGYIVDLGIAGIIGAVIAVAGSIIAYILTNSKGYKNISAKLGELNNTTLSGKLGDLDNTTLSRQHKDIEDKIDTAIKNQTVQFNHKIGDLNNTSLSRQQEDIYNEVKAFKEEYQHDKISHSVKTYFMDDDKIIINKSVENLAKYADIMGDLSKENFQLKIDIKTQNLKIKKMSEVLEKQNSIIKDLGGSPINIDYKNSQSFTQDMN